MPAKKSIVTQNNKPNKTGELLANGAIETAPEFARVMAALMSDVVNETISPKIANAVCNAGGKLLKVVEMQHRYGTPGAEGTNKKLRLVPGENG